MQLAYPLTNPRDPADWTYQHAASVVAMPKPADGVGDGLRYLQGDHHQDGVPWKGPPAAPGDTESIRKSLVPVPESARAINTRVNGACGNEPDISVEPKEPAGKDDDGNPAPSDEQQRLAEEWTRDLTAWWNDNNLWGGKDLRRPTGVRGMVAYASAMEPGSACLRVFVNPASLREGEDGRKRVPPERTRREALQHLKIVALPPDRCRVYVDPDTQQKTGVFLYRGTDDRQHAEIWYERVDNGRRVTVLRQLANGEETAEPQVFPWGGLLPIQQADVGLLLTEPILLLQAAIDFESSALRNNAQNHGYTQRTESGAEDDGDWLATPPTGVANPRTRIIGGETEYFNPRDPTLGSSTIRQLRGYPYLTGVDDKGKETYGLTTPTVSHHEPSPPEAIIGSLNAHIMVMREGVHQGHITSGLAGGSTAEASGDAYEQRRADFEQDIKGVAETVDMTVGAILTVATVMADWITGQAEPTFADEWSVKVQSHPSAGPVSSARETSIIALKQAEIISGEEATARVGVQDVQKERTRIAAERDAKSKAEVAKALIDTGADAETAYTEAGFDEMTAKRMVRSDGPPFVEQ